MLLRVTEVKLLHPEKEELPMLFTLAGKVTDVIEQFLKAQTPMVSKLLQLEGISFEIAPDAGEQPEEPEEP